MSEARSSEEKSVPPSQKRLRDARRKGQVSGSQDFVSALVVTATVGYLWNRWPAVVDRLGALLQAPSDLSGPLTISNASSVAGRLSEIGVSVVLPILLLAVVAAIVGNLIVKRGMVVSFEPAMPNLERIHPMSGLKRIFSLKSLLDFVKSLLKAALLLAGLSFAVVISVKAMLLAPACGLRCVTAVAGAALGPLLGIAVAVFWIAGLFDMPIQRWLFLRDMRMTKTEAKRERRDTEGDPTFRRLRRQRHREAASAATKLGFEHATVVVAARGRLAVGLRFVRNETPAPIVVARVTGEQASAALEACGARGTLVVSDEPLAERLSTQVTLGAFIPQSLFTEVAAMLVRHGLI